MIEAAEKKVASAPEEVANEAGEAVSAGESDGRMKGVRAAHSVDAALLPRQRDEKERKETWKAMFDDDEDQEMAEAGDLGETTGQGMTRDEDGSAGGDMQKSGKNEFLSINEKMRNALKDSLGIVKPTRVQARTLPVALRGKDVMVKSKTGSGKTLSYLLPVMHLLQQQRVTRDDGTFVLVLAPTRELAVQILEVAEVLAKHFPWMVVGGLMGGQAKKKEKARLRKGVTVLVATPGRLLDHLNNTSSFKVDQLQWLVLDEADRLLDLGFERVIKETIRVLDERRKNKAGASFGLGAKSLSKSAKKGKGGGRSSGVGRRRQTLLISATLSKGVKKLAGFTLHKPAYLSLDGDDAEDQTMPAEEEVENGSGEKEEFRVPDHLQQHFVVTPTKRKLVTLASFIRLETCLQSACKMLVFVSTTDGAEFLYHLFSSTRLVTETDPTPEESSGLTDTGDGSSSVDSTVFGCRVFKLHGNMELAKRISTFQEFKRAQSGIMVCTDVAARGLDIAGIHWIVQYDPPTETTEYVHRIGRTARMVDTGSSVIFLTEAERKYVELLQGHGLRLKELAMEGLLRTLRLPVSVPDMPDWVQLGVRFETTVQENRPLYELACNAFRSSSRAYATFPRELKYIFHVRNLHLGHLARCFALKNPPSKLMDGRKAKFHKQKGNLKAGSKTASLDAYTRSAPQATKTRLRQMSEFDAGF
mmetsp:Transcript_8208/g.34466  ORF Transcript_8208/g.34466 Transcript_8208/m.34466 type:complete len:701 (+) Transcript_8208:263-2365(+)